MVGGDYHGFHDQLENHRGFPLEIPEELVSNSNKSEICDCSCVTFKPRNYSKMTLFMHAPTFEGNILNLHL